MIARHRRVMRFLEKEAWNAPKVSGSRIVAMLSEGTDHISLGWSQYKTSPFQARFGKNEQSIYLHAEVHAIHKAIKALGLERSSDEDIAETLRNTTLYVCRVKFNDCSKNVRIAGLAKPCPGCQEAINKYAIRRVVYSLDGSWDHLGIWERED